jgi:hypothetical protein
LVNSGSTHGSTSPEVISSNDNSQFYFSSSDTTGAATVITNTILESPSFSTVGLSAASLSFYHYYKDYDANDSIRVLISTDGGTNWTRIYLSSATVGAANAFANQVVSLNSYVGFANVKFRFNYNAKWGWFWNIDNVSVTGTYSSAPAATFAWTSSPAGFTSALQNPTGVSPTASTTYTVTATNSYGCTTSASTTLVTVNTTPSTPTGSGASRCDAGTVTLTAAAGTGETIDWYSAASGGSALSGGTGVTSFTTPSISTTTTYYAEARNTTSSCLSTSRLALTATVTPTLTPSVSIVSSDADNIICAGTSVTFTATPTNGGTPTYQWKLNGNNVGTGSTTYTSTSLANGDVVSVVMTSTYACTTGSPIVTSNSITTTVNAIPSAPTGTSGSRCGTGTVGISATAGAGETIDWYSAATGGTLLLSNNTNYTTPSISATTT